MSSEEKFKALDEARKKMQEKIEEARREYVETKLKLFPELKAAGIPPEQLGQMLDEKEKQIKELQEKIAALEKRLAEVEKK